MSKRELAFVVILLSFGIWVNAQSTGGGGGGSTQNAAAITIVGAGSTTVGQTGNTFTVSSSGAALAGGGTNYIFYSAGYQAYGSTDTKIARVSNIVQNTGNGIVYNFVTNDANGTTFTFLRKCRVDGHAEWISPLNGSQNIGFSLNSTNLTVNIGSIPPDEQLANDYRPGVATDVVYAEPTLQWVVNSNDVLRLHGVGAVPNTPSSCRLRFITVPLP